MANLQSLNIDGDLILDKVNANIQSPGTAIHVDLSLGNYFEVDFQNVSGSITTFTVNNPHASQVSSFVLKITQGSLNWGIDWGGLSAFDWDGGSPGSPNLSAGNDAIDILRFTSASNSTSLWYGEVVGLNFT